MGAQAPAVAGFITVNDAANRLGVKPWDVRRMVDDGEVRSLLLVELASLPNTQETP